MNKDPFADLRLRFPQHTSQIDLVEKMASSLDYGFNTRARVARWFNRGGRWHEVEEAQKMGFLDEYIRRLAVGHDEFEFLCKEAKSHVVKPSLGRAVVFRVASAGMAIARSLGFF